MASPSKAGVKKGKGEKIARRRHTGMKAIAEEPSALPSAAHPAAASSLTSSASPLAETQLLPTPAVCAAALPDAAEQERAVEAAKATIPTGASREELRKDPIYRIMHTLPRSDVLEVVRSRFAAPHCVRAAAYFDLSYMKNPLRRLRLQIGCDGPTGLHLFFPRITAHRHTLRVLDLSRNRLAAEDVVLLCNLLGFGVEGAVASARPPHEISNDSSSVLGSSGVRREGGAAEAETRGSNGGGGASSPTTSPTSCLELLDLSYNTKIGNHGAAHVLRALRRCQTIRAVMLKSVGVDDAGAFVVSDIVRHWPAPVAPVATPETGGLLPSSVLLRPSTASATKFYLNLNENYIGARGTYLLGKGLPDYVSLTLAKQRPPLMKDRKRARDNANGGK